MNHQIKGASLISVGILIGLIGVVAIGVVSVLGSKTNTTFLNATSNLAEATLSSTTAPGETAPEIEVPTQPLPEFHSCNEIYNDDNMTPSGVYPINVNDVAINVYCKMYYSGYYSSMPYMIGGWTLITAQKEQDAVMWGSGINPDRDPSTYLDSSFSLSDAQTPTHSSIMFGYSSSTTYPFDAIFPQWSSLQTTDGAFNTIASGYDTKSRLYRVMFGKNTKQTGTGATNFVPEAGTHSLTLWTSYSANAQWAFNYNTSPTANVGVTFSNMNLYSTDETEAWKIFVR